VNSKNTAARKTAATLNQAAYSRRRNDHPFAGSRDKHPEAPGIIFDDEDMICSAW
jgi:hypothetical protein